MPKFDNTETVQAKLGPAGTYLVYRISGNGQDRYERRKVTEVENGVNHTYGKAGSFPLTKARATAIGWKDRYVMQGWQPSVIDFGVTPATLIGRTLPPSRNIAGQPPKRWRVTMSPKDAGWTGAGIWEPEGMAIVKDGVIKVGTESSG
jgi:hypothetical protein